MARSGLRSYSLVACAFLAVVGCKTQAPDAVPSAASGTASAEALRAAPKLFGAPITPGPELRLADVLRAPERYRDQAITVEGHVRSACTRRGCWMEVAESADPA